MKDYIDLERERYGNKIEISWSVDGEINDKFIAPLLMLPFWKMRLSMAHRSK
jgi:sensor histidine kinase YesM